MSKYKAKQEKKGKALLLNYFETKHKSVKVIGNDDLVQRMFRDRGYKVIPDYQHLGEPDLICFTGGSDVSPSYYNEKNVACEYLDANRDRREVAAWNAFDGYPKVGICRGGQFLNILSGGKMWQDVNNHGRSHTVRDLLIYQTDLEMTSTHHQMMIPSDKGEVIGIAKEATFFVSADPNRPNPKFDTEVVYYEHTKSLCFQPHPEYVDERHDCNVYFFELVNMLL
jgi:hypothetical protein